MWSKCSSGPKKHFDHNDKHGVKLSQQRRSHYVANYQEFQRNVSLKISSRTNDRIKSEGQLQKDYQNFNSGNKNDLQPQKLHSGWWTDISKIPIIVWITHSVWLSQICQKSQIYKSGKFGLWQSLHLCVIVYKLWQILVHIFDQGGGGRD